MKLKLYIVIALSAVAGPSMAQLPEDAIRTSWYAPFGTARHQAIGGAMGSLGGEITSIYVNPAGLGMYKTSEFVLSPGFSMLNSKGSFRGSDAKADRLNKFNFGTTGFVIGFGDDYSRWNSKAFSIAVNRTANFNNNYFYRGLNDYSSFTEPLANEFFNFYSNQKNMNPGLSDADIIERALDGSEVSMLTKMSLYTYLVDVDSSTGNKNIISRAEEAGITEQMNNIQTKGGITEIAIGFATNMDDKLYLGASIGIPILNYERTGAFTETDASGNNDNDFRFTSLTETYTQKGAGFNVKLGLIFKPAEQLRIGFAIHSPTLYGLKERTSYKLVTDVENLFGAGNGLDSIQSKIFHGSVDPEFKYDLVSPWRFMLSGSYVIREVSDVTLQRGFITADIEYVTHGSSRFSSSEDYGDDEYYKGVNDAVKAAYKGAFNFRLGGEIKFNTIMGRLGFAYYGKPYDDKELKAHKMTVSGGLGYRNKGVFLDLTYVHSLNKDVHFPYRLDPPRLNTFANLKEGSGNVVLSLGFKL
jgi:long-subunit fatty acid transport protein